MEHDTREKLPSSVFIYSFYSLIVMMTFFLIVTNLSFFVEMKGIGSTRVTGLLFALNSVIMLIAGVSLPSLLKLRKYFLSVTLIMVSLGMYGIAISESFSVMSPLVLMSGFGIGALFPYLLNAITGMIPKSLAIKAMSIGRATAWFGQFLSPLFFGGIASLFDLNMLTIFKGFSAIALAVSSMSLFVYKFRDT